MLSKALISLSSGSWAMNGIVDGFSLETRFSQFCTQSLLGNCGFSWEMESEMEVGDCSLETGFMNSLMDFCGRESISRAVGLDGCVECLEYGNGELFKSCSVIWSLPGTSLFWSSSCL